MPAVARGDGVDSVYSLTGVGEDCADPTTTTTNQCSLDVFCNGTGIVRIGDLVGVHNGFGCSIDSSVLTTGSSKVIINGQGAGRLGDQYTPDNTITSGSEDTFMG